MSRRYAALLTDRQVEVLMFCDDTIQTVPSLWRAFKEVHEPGDPLWPLPAKESLYTTLRFLERRGLVLRNDGAWPHEWMASEDGQEALEAAESTPVLAPTRRLATA